mgnify:CR=1 FL=1
MFASFFFYNGVRPFFLREFLRYYPMRLFSLMCDVFSSVYSFEYCEYTGDLYIVKYFQTFVSDQ